MLPLLTAIVQLTTALISLIVLLVTTRQKEKDLKRSQRKKSQK